jgi:hypothetical protein
MSLGVSGFFAGAAPTTSAAPARMSKDRMGTV